MFVPSISKALIKDLKPAIYDLISLRAAVTLIFLTFILLGVCTSHPEPAIPTQTVRNPFIPYGVVYPYPAGDWTEADRIAIRERLGYLRGLGINTIVQVFSSRLIGTGRERNWLIFLDEAKRADMHVIARLYPAGEWNGQGFDFQTIQSFLSLVQDHPALLAYLGLHEPLEQLNSEQLREFYASVKKLAPKLPITHYMGHMAWFDKNPRFPNREFTAGICDICITWYYPARYENGRPVFEERHLRERLLANRRLIDTRAPDAKLWFLGQAYAQHKHRRQLRMPTPQEMEQIYAITKQAQVDGFLWYPWLHNVYDQVLSDAEMELQRQAVRQIFDRHVLQTLTP